MHDWLIENGTWGVALLMFLQNILPILPSEIIMPLAGFLASREIFDLLVVIIAGLAGSLLGHLPWYLIGYNVGEKKLQDFFATYGKWISLSPRHVERAEAWFDRNAFKAVLFGRLVPGVRTGINVPAGASRMAFLPFLGFTLLGDAAWTALLALGGYWLGRDYKLIGQYLHLIFWVAVLLIGATSYAFIRHRSSRSRGPGRSARKRGEHRTA